MRCFETVYPRSTVDDGSLQECGSGPINEETRAVATGQRLIGYDGEEIFTYTPGVLFRDSKRRVARAAVLGLFGMCCVDIIEIMSHISVSALAQRQWPRSCSERVPHCMEGLAEPCIQVQGPHHKLAACSCVRTWHIWLRLEEDEQP